MESALKIKILMFWKENRDSYDRFSSKVDLIRFMYFSWELRISLNRRGWHV